MSSKVTRPDTDLLIMLVDGEVLVHGPPLEDLGLFEELVTRARPIVASHERKRLLTEIATLKSRIEELTPATDKKVPLQGGLQVQSKLPESMEQSDTSGNLWNGRSSGKWDGQSEGMWDGQPSGTLVEGQIVS